MADLHVQVDSKRIILAERVNFILQEFESLRTKRTSKCRSIPLLRSIRSAYTWLTLGYKLFT